MIFGALRQHLGEIFRELALQKESKVVEGHLMPDHVHMCLRIPPKHSVSNVVGFIKGESAISIARQFGGRQQAEIIRFYYVAIIQNDWVALDKLNRILKAPPGSCSIDFL